jgi:hypothetical protein
VNLIPLSFFVCFFALIYFYTKIRDTLQCYTTAPSVGTQTAGPQHFQLVLPRLSGIEENLHLVYAAIFVKPLSYSRQRSIWKNQHFVDRGVWVELVIFSRPFFISRRHDIRKQLSKSVVDADRNFCRPLTPRGHIDNPLSSVHPVCRLSPRTSRQDS